MVKTQDNHEIWVVCPRCGCEYDARIWGDTCPECAKKTLNEIKNRRDGNKRHHKGCVAAV